MFVLRHIFDICTVSCLYSKNFIGLCLQCFDTVGRVAGRASGL